MTKAKASGRVDAVEGLLAPRNVHVHIEGIDDAHANSWSFEDGTRHLAFTMPHRAIAAITVALTPKQQERSRGRE